MHRSCPLFAGKSGIEQANSPEQASGLFDAFPQTKGKSAGDNDLT
jgi:hypothetical protein